MRRLPDISTNHPKLRMRDLLGNERGVALVLALLAVVMITAIVLEFDFRTRLDMRGAANFRDDTQAYLLADSAVKLARVLLVDEDKNKNVDHMDDSWAQAAAFANTPVGGGTVTLVIEDEDGKLDLNRLIKRDPGTGKEDPDLKRVDIFYRLLDILEVESDEANTMVDSLIDWIDGNGYASSYGAEDSHYENLDVPYRCRNGPLRTLDELLLVQGFDAKKLELISPHVTAIWEGAIKPAASNSKAGMVNINTASTELLMALHEDIDENIASAIYSAARDDDPFISNSPQHLSSQVTTLESGGNLAQELKALIRVNSEHFSVMARGQVGDTVRTVRVILHRPQPPKQGERIKVISWRVE